MNGLRSATWTLARAARQSQRGQALVMASIMMMTLIGFAALASDTGLIWVNRRGLQNAADAAALAGVQSLIPNDPATDAFARNYACDYATTKNGIGNMTIDCSGTGGDRAAACKDQPNVDILICKTYTAGDTIRVTTHKTINPIFGVAVGFTSVDIAARATALIGSVASACVFPVAQTQDLLEASGVWDGNGIILNKATIMKNGSNGEPLALQVYDSSSKSDWRNVVGSAAGCDGTQDTTATTSPGTFVGPLDQGMAERKTMWEAQGNCLSNNPADYLQPDGSLWNNGVQLTPETCYRMVKVPILDTHSSNLGGAATWNIKGFAVFYIANWCGQSSTPKVASGECAAPAPPFAAGTTLKAGELWGYYVGMTAAGGTDYQAYNGFGTRVAALVE